MIKKLFALIIMLTCLLSSSVFAFAENCEVIETTVGQPEINKEAKVYFIDENLKNKETKNDIGLCGVIHEEYDHSYYVFDHCAISAYSVGPRCCDVFLISVARGQEISLTDEKEVSASVTFSPSVEFNVKKVIKVGLGLDISGTYTHTWSRGVTFRGPEGAHIIHILSMVQ